MFQSYEEYLKENISDSIITVIGKYGRKYIEPLWMFTGIE